VTEMLFFRANLLELYFFFFGIVCTLLSLKSKSSPWLSIISIVVVNVIVSEEHLHNCGVSGILSIQALLPLTLSLQIYILFIRALAIYAHVRLVLNVHIIPMSTEYPLPIAKVIAHSTYNNVATLI